MDPTEGITRSKEYIELCCLILMVNRSGGTEDVTDYAGRRKQCIDCDKILPRKLFEEMME